MIKAIKFVDKWFEEFFCSVFLVALVSLLGAQVFTRFVLNYSVSWHEEVIRYLFIWLVYLGVSLGVKRREHIRILVFLRFIPTSVHRPLYYVAESGWLLFCLYVFYLSIDMMKTMFTFRQLSASLQWNMAYIYLIIPFAMLLTSYRIVQGMYMDWKNRANHLTEGA